MIWEIKLNLSRLLINRILKDSFSVLKLSSRRAGVYVRIIMSDRKLLGFTIIELLIALSITGILASIGGTLYVGQINKARTNVVIADIKAISLDIDAFIADNGGPPNDLSSVRHDMRRDPWGNPYRYLRITGVTGLGGMRKDRFIVPLNSDYDLYSMGADGQSKPPLTASVSKDDIIRANDGGYVGPAYAY